MKTISCKIRNIVTLVLLPVLAFLISVQVSPAKDTDVYNVVTKQNSYVLMDNSASMDYGVYEQNVDYGAMFDYLITLNDTSTAHNKYIYDTVTNSSQFYNNHNTARKIYLQSGNIGLTMATVNGKTIAFTGDAADPRYIWYSGGSNTIDTHTLVDAMGNLSDDGTGKRRITVDSQGHILFDGSKLPGSQDILLNDPKVLYDGSIIDQGFGGIINAPGYYFSGYGLVSDTVHSAVTAVSGTSNIFFFMTGNWLNMQCMYNLQYVGNPNPYPAGATVGADAWRFEYFPLAQSAWAPVAYNLIYPNPNPVAPAVADPYDTVGSTVYYKANVTEANSVKTIVPSGAVQIQVHFSHFDIDATQTNSTNDAADTLKIYDQNNTLKATYNNASPPNYNGESGWSAPIAGGKVYLKLTSGATHQGTGYVVDQIRVTYYQDAYLMQTRLSVAKDAMTYALNALSDNINWGLANFAYDTSGATPKSNGAAIGTLINPSADPAVQQNSIISKLQGLSAVIFNKLPAGFKANSDNSYDISPLGEALQDIFQKGFYENSNKLSGSLCSKNSVIVVTDGYESGDTNWSKIKINGITTSITGSYTSKFTQDPYQYTAPPPSYYDGVAAYLYTHSWMDNSVVPDPANSTVNVTTHQITFGGVQPLLMNAAQQGGGQYITAYNKAQLSAALYSVALQMSNTVSFTAPIASVDSNNKTQNGNDLYFSYFLPQNGKSWAGNLKKFEMGDGSTQHPDSMMIYDGANKPVLNSSGTFINTITDMWTNTVGPIDVKNNGAGQILLTKVQNDFASSNFWNRNIYTSIGGTLTKLTRTISPAQLAVTDTATRDKVINYTYGYTYDADAAGNPIAVRDWVLGSIVHSKPLIVDYYNPSNSSQLTTRYIVVGANDGMLHVFDDTPGSGKQGAEVFAFVPGDLLSKLQNVAANDFLEMVDGSSVLYRQAGNPKYLIFGERRGGKYFWCLDVSNSNPAMWSVKWQYGNAEIQQSWSDIQIASLPITANPATGAHMFQDVLVLTGGYDALEDGFPEPFNDPNRSGTPYKTGTVIDPVKWSPGNPNQDINGNGIYDIFNPDVDTAGRGIFIVDIDDPAAIVQDGTGNAVLPFSVTFGTADRNTVNATVNTQTRTDMKYCFPASPALVLGTYNYFEAPAGKALVSSSKPDTLAVVYGVDIYSNAYRLDYNFNEQIIKDPTHPENTKLWRWSTAGNWSVEKIFSGNPGSTRGSGVITPGADNPADQGRKAFYPPVISWGGSCSFFDKSNYNFPNVAFSGTDKIATLLFGTGDREHPTYNLVRDRVYSVYDDSPVTAQQFDGNGNFLKNIIVSTASYTEKNLLNLTCNELGAGSATSPDQKTKLLAYLTDDVTRLDSSNQLVLENGIEDDAKGWYIVLQDQENCTVPSGTLNAATTDSADNHDGEKVLSQANLYAGILYFTSFQPTLNDPCNPRGNGFAYSLDYCTSDAAYNLSTANGDKLELTDRYMKYTGIYGIPSGFAILIRNGQASAMAMMGSEVIGPKGPGTFQINSPGLGLNLYYWREGNSQKK